MRTEVLPDVRGLPSGGLVHWNSVMCVDTRTTTPLDLIRRKGNEIISVWQYVFY